MRDPAPAKAGLWRNGIFARRRIAFGKTGRGEAIALLKTGWRIWKGGGGLSSRSVGRKRSWQMAELQTSAKPKLAGQLIAAGAGKAHARET